MPSADGTQTTLSPLSIVFVGQHNVLVYEVHYLTHETLVLTTLNLILHSTCPLSIKSLKEQVNTSSVMLVTSWTDATSPRTCSVHTSNIRTSDVKY